MRLPVLLTTLLCLAAPIAEAAGIHAITVPPDAEGRPIAGMVWYPCSQPTSEIAFGRTTLVGTKDCPVTGEKLPLIVLSHGYSGKLSSHHDTAETLADAGFVVVAINHPVDSGPDMSRADTLAMLTERPRDIRSTIDYMLDAWPDRARLDAAKIGFFGFSRGGYTGLVAIGANPDIANAVAICGFCGKASIPPEAFVHDPRINAAVIVDPPGGSAFTRESLKDVKVPVQLWASELSARDRVGVTPDDVAAIGRNLPARSDYHLVANAGHYAFLTPCPAAMAQALPMLCTDQPGFDRVAFHREFDAAIVAFFRANL